jgi:hypothetical protein
MLMDVVPNSLAVGQSSSRATKTRNDISRPCLGYQRHVRKIVSTSAAMKSGDHSYGIEAVRDELTRGKFWKGDLALFAMDNREEMKNRFGGVRSDEFILFGSYAEHPYHKHLPHDGDAFFLLTNTDPKGLSPSGTSRSCWKESGSPQALRLTSYRTSTRGSSGDEKRKRTPLCVYKNYHYSVESPHGTPGGKRAAREKLLTMRVYTIHEGHCDCNACRRSREQTLAKKSEMAILAREYALVLVLDAAASGVWKRRRTCDDGSVSSEASAASTPTSSSNSAEIASIARTVRAAAGGGTKSPYVRPLIFLRAEDDLRINAELSDSSKLAAADV